MTLLGFSIDDWIRNHLNVMLISAVAVFALYLISFFISRNFQIVSANLKPAQRRERNGHISVKTGAICAIFLIVLNAVITKSFDISGAEKADINALVHFGLGALFVFIYANMLWLMGYSARGVLTFFITTGFVMFLIFPTVYERPVITVILTNLFEFGYGLGGVSLLPDCPRGEVPGARLCLVACDDCTDAQRSTSSITRYVAVTALSVRRLLKILLVLMFVYVPVKYLIEFKTKQLVTAAGGDQDRLDLRSIQKALSVFVWLVAIVIAMGLSGVDLLGVGLFSGLIGAGLSISIRDVLNNIFSGFLLHWDGSIKDLDTIRLPDGTQGRVKNVSLRYTFLSTPDEVDILVPNSLIASSKIENLTRRSDVVRLSFKFQVSQDADIREVAEVSESACILVPEVARVSGKSPGAFYLGSDRGAHLFDLRFWVESPKKGEGKLRSEVAYHVFAALKQRKVPLASFMVTDVASTSLARKATPALARGQVRPERPQK